MATIEELNARIRQTLALAEDATEQDRPLLLASAEAMKAERMNLIEAAEPAGYAIGSDRPGSRDR